MKKILIVEDEYIIALVQVKFLQKKGFEVVTVGSGKAAINAVKDFSPDLIVMDIRIEGDMDGIETMIEIEKFASIPVVYCTGNSEEAIIDRARKTNMKGFLVKPINNTELEEIINLL
ncbi:MAG: hypothetical protein K0S44_3160 [Bacteroidetes bacterium]|jgi:CheY-like chemotaxis protein|nr:hypothetical protein [Bacteroidota bacterium]